MDEREEIGKEYKRLNKIDSELEDDRDAESNVDADDDDYITEEMQRAKDAVVNKTDEFKAKDHEVQEAKEDYEKTTGKDLPEPE